MLGKTTLYGIFSRHNKSITGYSLPHFPFLRDQAKRLDVPFEKVGAALWRQVASSPEQTKEFVGWLPRQKEDLEDFWRSAPASLFKGPLFDVVLNWEDVPRSVLQPEQWRAFLSAWTPDTHSHEQAPWEAMGEDIAVEAIRRCFLPNVVGTRELLRILWQRFPDRVRRETLEILGKEAAQLRQVDWPRFIHSQMITFIRRFQRDEIEGGGWQARGDRASNGGASGRGRKHNKPALVIA